MARGHLEFGTHNGSETECFRAAWSSLLARAAPLPLLDPVLSSNL